MTWDLFTAAEAEARNAALARAVAAGEADAGFHPLPRREEGWSVSAVNAMARELVEGMLPPLWVTGEVTGFTRARSGHCYFSLRDREAQIRCVMWRDEARRLPTAPAEGMQVRALGRLTIYEARGEFQLTVAELEGRGEGLWKLAFERLHSRLQTEGLTAPERKRPIPRCPRRVGVVTSPTGAAVRDILSVIGRRAPWTEVILCGCRVQGEGAADEIARAIRRFARAGCADVLIIGRGGGSREDLWAFNEEVVARAISESPVPTISAVGHETDVCIADLVADLRAPTPSAAAEAAVPHGATFRRELLTLRQRARDGIRNRLAESRGEVAAAARGVQGATERRLRLERDRLGARAARLHALSPLGALARGFAVPLGPNGVLRSGKEFQPGERFRLRVADAVVPCRVDGAPEPVGEEQ